MNGGSTFSVPRSAGLDLGLVRLEHMERIRLLIVDDEDAFQQTVAKRLMFFLYLARWLQYVLTGTSNIQISLARIRAERRCYNVSKKLDEQDGYHHRRERFNE